MIFHKCHSDRNVNMGKINISLTLKWAQSAVIIEVNRSENPKGVALWMPLPIPILAWPNFKLFNTFNIPSYQIHNNNILAFEHTSLPFNHLLFKTNPRIKARAKIV